MNQQPIMQIIKHKKNAQKVIEFCFNEVKAVISIIGNQGKHE